MLTTAVAFVDLGPFSVVVALAIAVVQDAAGGALLHARAPQHQAHEAGGAGRPAVAGDPDHAHDGRLRHRAAGSECRGSRR